MATLFQIGSELQALQELLVERDGDVTDPIIAAAIDQWFIDIAANEGEKIDSYIGLIRQNEMEAAAAAEEYERWTMKAKARENAAKRLKDRLKAYLEFTGRTKVTSATGRVAAIQANSAAPLEINPGTEPKDVADHFRKVTIEFNTTAIKDAIKAGVGPGWAKMGEKGSHLRIR